MQQSQPLDRRTCQEEQIQAGQKQSVLLPFTSYLGYPGKMQCPAIYLLPGLLREGAVYIMLLTLSPRYYFAGVPSVTFLLMLDPVKLTKVTPSKMKGRCGLAQGGDSEHGMK